jgi:hypothetical protein
VRIPGFGLVCPNCGATAGGFLLALRREVEVLGGLEYGEFEGLRFLNSEFVSRLSVLALLDAALSETDSYTAPRRASDRLDVPPASAGPAGRSPGRRSLGTDA